MVNKFIKRGYIFLILAFLYAPIFLLIVYSFNLSKEIGTWSTEWGFEHYKLLFTDETILSAVSNTLILAFVAATLATILGTIGAIGSFYSKKSTQKLLGGATQIPVLFPESGGELFHLGCHFSGGLSVPVAGGTQCHDGSGHGAAHLTAAHPGAKSGGNMPGNSFIQSCIFPAGAQHALGTVAAAGVIFLGFFRNRHISSPSGLIVSLYRSAVPISSAAPARAVSVMRSPP